MSVNRIVPNVSTDDIVLADQFYGDMLRMDIAMDLGWIVTYRSRTEPAAQISVLTKDKTAPETPDLSIEVRNVENAYNRAQRMGFEIIHPLTEEEWGVRRFLVRDPFGRVVNVLGHV
ncbi:MAG: VOC family protein [Pseudomonadota bacterium]